MAGRKPMFTVNPTVDEYDDIDEETDKEAAIRWMAESNPVGQEARRRMQDHDDTVVPVKLRGNRQMKNNSHRIDLDIDGKLQTVFFYNGEGMATEAQKAELVRYNYIS